MQSVGVNKNKLNKNIIHNKSSHYNINEREMSSIGMKLMVDAKHGENIEKIYWELQNEINQMLFAVKIKLENATYKLKGNKSQKSVNEEILQATDFLSTVISNIREISSSINSVLSENKDFFKSIQNLCYEYSNRNGRKYIFKEHKFSGELPVKTQNVAFRIISEIFWSAYHHSSITVLSLELDMKDNNLLMIIKGNEKNLFEDILRYENNETIQKMELLYIEQNVKLLKGKISIEHKKGTKIYIAIPIYEKE